jgi:POT family proton-dependent oligopeptide transporter
MSQVPPPLEPVPATHVTAHRERRFLGHPVGLVTLFFAEMWERFSYYGMRAILILFMTALTMEQANQPAPAPSEGASAPADAPAESAEKPSYGGLGFSKAKAGVIYALYTSLVYFTGLAGGWLADNVIGQRRAVFWGGVVIMFGHVALAFHGMPFFYSGLGMIVVGTGLLKPNISTMVGLLYPPGDSRRDAGFSIYYMGINLGSFLGQSACGFFAQDEWFIRTAAEFGITRETCWHIGFASAAVGMFFGLVVFYFCGNWMGEAGRSPNPPRDEREARIRRGVMVFSVAGLLLLVASILVTIGLGFGYLFTVENIGKAFGIVLLLTTILCWARIFVFEKLTGPEGLRLGVVAILFLAAILFWGAFEQAGGTLNLLADEQARNDVLGRSFPSSYYQNVNPFLIIFLAPVFSLVWHFMGKRNPSSSAKFSMALGLVGVGFVFAYGAARQFESTGVRFHPLWLVAVYFFHSVGELCLSPIGLSMVTALSPKRLVSQVMGIWFLSNANANYLAGVTVGLTEKWKNSQVFMLIALITIGGGLVFAILTPFINRMMKPANHVTEA